MKRRKGLTEGEKKTRGGENGETGFIEISRGKVKEERKKRRGEETGSEVALGRSESEAEVNKRQRKYHFSIMCC